MTARTASAAEGRRQSVGRPRFRLAPWLVAGVIGWAGFALLLSAMLSTAPPTAGFDLELILEAGRRVAAGASPYDPALLAGTARLEATDLFYSYPPPAAQLAALLAGVPSMWLLVGLGTAAVAGALAVGRALARRLTPALETVDVVVPLAAVLPFAYPFAVALLFGNLDALYPLLYGLMLLAMLAPASSRARPVAGGIALAVATVAKVHPAAMGVWFLVRAVRDSRARLVVGAAVAAALAILALSLLGGGTGPWRDYVSVASVAASAELVLRNNVGPAAQLAAVLGAGESLARGLQVVVAVVALGGAALAARRVADPVLSVALATVASLVVLPVTWFHYPAALIPFALAAALRARGTAAAPRVAGLLVGAVVVAALSILAPVAVWAAVALVVAAVAAARPPQMSADA